MLTKRRVLSGAMALLICCTTIFNANSMAFAAETSTPEIETASTSSSVNAIKEENALFNEKASSLPTLSEIQDKLEADEIVTVEDLTIVAGDSFDISSDFSKISFSEEKVKIKFKNAVNEELEEFHVDRADRYQAVYEVIPVRDEALAYQVNRMIIVSEKEPETASQSEHNPGTEKTESDDEEADPDTEVTESELVSAEEETETLMANEASEEQESAETTEDVMVVSEEENLVVSVVPATMSARSSSGVTLVKGELLPYPSYLGDYFTNYFYVNGKIAYCLESPRRSPEDGNYIANVLNSNKKLQKVLYYGYGGPGDITKEYFPNLDKDTRYIYTHIAASYAYIGEDGLHGCSRSALEKYGVMDYIDHLFNMEEPPIAAISLNNNYEEAYFDGDVQKTDTFKLTGDHRNYVTLKVPEGVTYHNVTDKAEQTGGTVKIYGDTKFYFTAPRSLTGEWSSGTLKGQIASQWKTLVLSTGDGEQDIGYGDYIEDTANSVSFKVKWMDLAKVTLIKKDLNTDVDLSGAVFGIYADKECTNLIKEMPATDKNGSSSVEIPQTQDTVYIKEITAPTNYCINATGYNVKLVAGDTTELTVKNEEVRAKIHVEKIDKETEDFLSQGDATLVGAEYGLYAAEDIKHPDGKTEDVYKKGALVAKGKIAEDGTLDFTNLYLGKYYVKEITPSEGYLLDETEYPVEATYEGQDVSIVHRDVTVNETVKKQPFQLIKVGSDGEQTEADLLQKAGFKVYLISSLKGVQDGSIKPDANGNYSPVQFKDYDFTNETTALDYSENNEGVPMEELFTDEKGHAVSKELAYGKYVVVETTVPADYVAIDPFIVTINDDSSEPQQWRVFIDYEFQAILKIYKIDGTSKLPVLHAGATFKIYNMDTEEYVTQHTHYPTLVKHTEFKTSDEGYLMTPEKLEAGHYRLEEISAPEGYVKGENVEFTLGSDVAYEVEEETGAIIIKMEYENDRQTGTLRLHKLGEQLTGYEPESKSILERFGEFLNIIEETEEENHFVYQKGNVEGAGFEVYATEDIYSPDHQLDAEGNRIVLYHKDELVSSIVTDKDGMATLEELPLGSYKIVETVAGEGFVINKEIQEFTLSYAGDEVEVVYHDSEFTNERQRVSIKLEKVDAETKKPVEGATFGLYAAEDILAADGAVAVAADTLIETAVSDEEGIVTFTKDLPIAHYYVLEEKAASGYVKGSEKVDFDLQYSDQNSETLTAEAVVENDYTKVEISKVDIGGEDVIGAELTIKDSEGNEVASWVTDGSAHRIDRLKPGKYVLIEVLAPDGYEIAEEIEFTVLETGEIQKVEMVDEYEKKGTISVEKVGDMLVGITTYDSDFGQINRMEYEKRNLPGVEFTIYDEEGNVVDVITTSEDGVATSEELSLGKYTLKETKTPAGLAMNYEEYEVVLEKDNENKVVDISLDIENDVIDTEINVYKVGEMLNPENGTFAYGKKPLEGVYFGIYTNEDIKNYLGESVLPKDSLIGVIKTNAEGKATLRAALVSGKYYYKELQTLEGYILDEEKHAFELTLENEPVTVFDVNKENPAINMLMKATVSLVKVDAENESKRLSGAEFELYTSDGKLIGTYITDENGEINVEDLAYGDYYFKEKNAPTGYQKLADNIEFSMKGQDITITCRNHEIPEIVVPKLGFEDSNVGIAIAFVAIGAAVLGIGFFVYKKKKKSSK